MNFLNPLMLAGIAAVGIPILIHLLNRRKYQRVVWAAMRFLESAIEKNKKRMRIEDLLLLILRCLVVAIFAIALARPAVHAAAGSWLGGGGVTAVVAIDNSFSMSGGDGVSSRFENAKTAAKQVIDALPSGSSVSVLLMSDAAEPLILDPTSDLNVAKSTITAAKLCDRRSEMTQPINKSIEILNKRTSGRKELYLITDGQHIPGWTQLGDIVKRLSAEDEITTRLVLVGPEVESNLALVSLKAAGQLPVVDHPLRFEAAVKNFGATAVSDVHVKLNIDPPTTGDATGAPAVDEGTIEKLGAGETGVVSLAGKLRGEGSHVVAASLPGDHLPADDSRSIVVHATAQIRVTLVDGEIPVAGSHTGGYFLKNALLPVPPSDADRYFVKLTRLTVDQLPGQRFDNTDVVFLTDVAELDGKTADMLSDFVHHGGGLVIFPGPNTNITNWNQQLFDQRGLLPAKLGTPRGKAGQDKDFFTLQAAQRYDHPIAEIWNDRTAGTPASAHFYESYTLVEPSADAVRILQYSDNTPAIMERSVGLGRVTLFSSTAGTTWNDLPARPGIFLPLVQRVLASLLNKQDETLNIPVGHPFVYRTPNDELGDQVTITSPDGNKETRQVELLGSDADVQRTETSIAGVYDVKIASQPPADVKFATLRDPDESNLQPLGTADLQTLGNAMQVVRWDQNEPFDQTLRTARAGRELWTSLAIAVLLLAVAETFLGNSWSRSR